jgi:ribose transport system ATP-binding protein
MEMNIIETVNLCKEFPGVQALDNVDFMLRKGEVHALVGENGAGKSTLIKILGGVHHADQGKVLINSNETILETPQEARENGVIVIYQELSLVPYLTVAENIFLGNLPKVSGFIDKKTLFDKADKILKQLNCSFRAADYVGKLSTGKKQMVEIARALAHKARVVIFDEPTASLSESETEILFKNISNLKKKGTSVIYISHKLDEVFSISDRITVMRDGNIVSTVNTDESTESSIVEMMIGRNIENYYTRIQKEIGKELLRVEDFSSSGVFSDISFNIKHGEILGFYGLVGAGRSELMRSLFGVDKRDSGDIFLDSKKTIIRHPIDAVNVGIALVPEERKEEGLILPMDVSSNLSLVKIREMSRSPFLNKNKQGSLYNEFKKKFSIKAASGSVPVQNLSGGNQQKVVLAKWLSMNPKILILDEPTRGIDVGSKSEIHKIISELSGKGMAIIVISSEMPEIIGLCDRIITMCSGRITGNFSGDEISEKNLMYAIANLSKEGRLSGGVNNV